LSSAGEVESALSATALGAAADSPALATFSVVVPLYQKRHRVAACLASVGAQSLAPLEVLVIDDGSTDGGADVAAALGNGLVRCVRQDNQGAAAARNHGVELARGDYIAFLDADDTWQPGHLAALAGLAARHPAATILGTSWSESGLPVRDAELDKRALDSGDRLIDLATFLDRATSGLPPFWTSAVAVRRDAVPDGGLFPVGSRVAEDQHAWLRLLERGSGVRGADVTADYYLDPVSPTMARPHADDFDSVIFTEWSRLKGPAYRRFVTGQRLYTIERHIGRTPDRVLLGHLLRTGRPLQPVRRLRILARMLRVHLRRLAGRARSGATRTAVGDQES
jgi:glycosyltransferase involved in cell wall biosynthesis